MSNQYAQVEKETDLIGAWFLQTIKPAETDTHYYELIEPQFSFKTSPRPSQTSFLKLIGGKPTWVETASLEESKSTAWERVKVARDEAESAPFEFEGAMYDPNKVNVSGAALAAVIAQLNGHEVSQRWTLADNTVLTLTGPQLIALGVTLTGRIDSIHAHSRELRALIENATTADEALSYTWEYNANN